MMFAIGFLENALNNGFSAISASIIRIFFAILLFLFGFIIGKLIGRLIYKFLNEIELNRFLKDSINLKLNADHLISGFVSYSIYFLSLIAALEQIGVANTILYFISAAVIIIILLSFFISIRDFLPNFISGIYLYTKEELRPGNVIQVENIKGELIHIDLFQIRVKTDSGDIIYIPNSTAAKSIIKIKKPVRQGTRA